MPTKAHHLSRQTIQTASRTMRPDILLWPSLRSLKVMVIYRMRNPFRQARNDISIWKE